MEKKLEKQEEKSKEEFEVANTQSKLIYSQSETLRLQEENKKLTGEKISASCKKIEFLQVIAKELLKMNNGMVLGVAKVIEAFKIRLSETSMEQKNGLTMKQNIEKKVVEELEGENKRVKKKLETITFDLKGLESVRL